MNDQYVKNVIEAALLAAGRPLTMDELVNVFDERDGSNAEEVRSAIAALTADYETRGLELLEVASGFRIQIRAGVAEPVSVNVDTFGTNTVPETAIMKAVMEVFDLTPKGIINALDLRKPIYSPTSSYGHFGRAPKKNGKGTLFTWERLDRVADLKKAVNGK